MAEENGMNIINSHIENNSYSNIYLLGGDEKYLLNQYKNKLLGAITDVNDTMNFCAFKGSNINSDEIYSFATTMPFFADRRVVLVEGSDFFKKGNETIEKLFEDIPETTIIVFSEDNIDKRSKLYKAVVKKGVTAFFSTPDERTLLVWLKSLFSKDGVSINDKTLYKLIEGVGTDMNTLFNEVEKLKSYCYDKKIVNDEDVDVLCVNQIEGKIFDMMDALSRKDKKKTIDLYNDLVLLREPAMRILFLIARQFNLCLKTKLALQSNYDNSKIASVIKVPPFAVKKYIGFCNGYTYDELVEKVNLCQEADSDIKSGRMRDALAVETLIINLLH